MNFESFFRLVSYAAVFCGFLSLWVAGTFGVLTALVFIAVFIAGWLLEGTRFQIVEWLGTVLIVATLPLYYGLWKLGIFSFADSGALVASLLGRVILSLTMIKLLQRKSDRDWIFLYIMAFFEVLLAAGLSISAGYLLSFVVFVFVAACAVILFEIRRTRTATRSKIRPGHAYADDEIKLRRRSIPATALILIFFIVLVAVPLFFALPRVGVAGFGNRQGGVSTSVGFSDVVRLGGIGNIQLNDQVVMRVRIEGSSRLGTGHKWRGVALDTFDNKSWGRTRSAHRAPRGRNERDIIVVGDPKGSTALTLQTIYLEPLDTTVLFALPRPVGVQGSFPLLFKDDQDGVSYRRDGDRFGYGDRVNYKVLSDETVPSAERLRADNRAYPEHLDNYLQLPPDIDPRIADLAHQITEDSASRYDSAKALEGYLQNSFGYTLEQKAAGEQPLADFLFNVREGHCEYFATAMAVMLRTQGIATRVVNGFSGGDYNETADIWVVRQRQAHSWVEVYFPAEDAWVTFDPTPFSGQPSPLAGTGFTASLNKYLEALETYWIQYFVAFDNQEQRSMFSSIKRGVRDYQQQTSGFLDNLRNSVNAWWRVLRGDDGLRASAEAVGSMLLYLAIGAVLLLVVGWMARKIVKSKFWRSMRVRLVGTGKRSQVEFYERLQQMLSEQGKVRQPYQTPLEFAAALQMPPVMRITEEYHRVRFGGEKLSDDDLERIDMWLEEVSSINEEENVRDSGVDKK